MGKKCGGVVSGTATALGEIEVISLLSFMVTSISLISNLAETENGPR